MARTHGDTGLDLVLPLLDWFSLALLLGGEAQVLVVRRRHCASLRTRALSKDHLQVRRTPDVLTHHRRTSGQQVSGPKQIDGRRSTFRQQGTATDQWGVKQKDLFADGPGRPVLVGFNPSDMKCFSAMPWRSQGANGCFRALSAFLSFLWDIDDLPQGKAWRSLQ